MTSLRQRGSLVCCCRTPCEDMLVSPANGESDVRPRRHPFRSRRAGRALRECRAMKTMARLLLILLTFALVCLASLQNAQAVSPAPDGGYSGNNTAEGQDALLHLTTGLHNTAVGFLSLKSDRNWPATTRRLDPARCVRTGQKPKYRHRDVRIVSDNNGGPEYSQWGPRTPQQHQWHFNTAVGVLRFLATPSASKTLPSATRRSIATPLATTT
jgi:hypothetical protein